MCIKQLNLPQFIYLISSILLALIIVNLFQIKIIRISVIAIFALLFETMFNLFWEFVTGKKMFIYKYACLFNCNTSYLNVVFWFDGIAVLKILSDIFFELVDASLVFVLITTFLFVVIGIFKMLLPRFKGSSGLELKLFYFAGFVAMIFVWFFTQSIETIVLLVLIGITAHVAELLMNLLIKLLAQDTYWDYLYKPYANGISSVFNILPFIYAASLFICLLSSGV